MKSGSRRVKATRSCNGTDEQLRHNVGVGRLYKEAGSVQGHCRASRNDLRLGLESGRSSPFVFALDKNEPEAWGRVVDKEAAESGARSEASPISLFSRSVRPVS